MLNETNMARIWNKHKQINPHTKNFGVGAGTPLKRKVFVAMSGGVDSSVAAALLQKQGFAVAGVFMHFWAEPGANRAENVCCSIESENDARQVAAKLQIPFYVFHFEKEFKKAVVDYFLKENAAGRTPNPCVMCNKYIKFGFLLKKALGLGFDYVATGHYVKNSQFVIRNQRIYKLSVGKDENKDQSYFLYTIGQGQLSHFLFPLGDYKKDKVRQIAKKFGLPTHSKPESFDLCFVGDSHTGFLRRHLILKSGDIVDKTGKVLGQHDGLALYTIGQRRDIKLSGGPYYVIGFNFKKNQLIVSNVLRDVDLFGREMQVENVSWILGKAPKQSTILKVKIRYRHKSVSAKIIKKISSDNYLLRFTKPQRAITSGQAAVFYYGKQMLGGGIIV